jgi:molybdenum cofactor cytidylyltransferase
LNFDNKYSGVLLAAGSSSRMSSWKPAAMLEDKPLLFYSLKTISDICSDVVVVGGYNIKELTSLVNDNANHFSSNIICVENKNYESGMFSSVKAGILQTQHDNVFISLADMPFITIETYTQLINFSVSEALSEEVIYPAIIHPLASDKIKKGHPILIKKRVKERIIKETEDVILRDILKEFKGKECIVTNSGIVFDIDTADDYERAKNYYSYLKNK